MGRFLQNRAGIPEGRMGEAAEHVWVMGSGCSMWLGVKDHDAKCLGYSLI